MSTILIKTKKEHYGGEVLREMQLLQDSGQLCDIVLVAAMDGQRFACHRLVLAASSEFFKRMFTTSMRESQQQEIQLGEVFGEQLRLLLNFIYTGEMELHDVEDETTSTDAGIAAVKELLCTASLLQFVAAVDACADYLLKHLTPSNCLGTFALAELYTLEELKRVAGKFINIKFVKVCQYKEFLELTFSQLALLIASDELIVPTERAVFYNVMSWVQHDPPARSKYVPELLQQLVRLPFLSPSFLAAEVQQICAQHDCLQLLDEVLLWQCQPEAPTNLCAQVTKPRRSENADLLAVSKVKDELIIQKYCATTDTWNSFGRMEPRRFYFAAVILKETLVIVGGLKDRCSISLVQSFDLKEKTSPVAKLSPMPTARYDLGVAVLEGLLYAIGGYDDRFSLNIVERYDPADDTWSTLAPMDVSRDSLGVAVLDGILYAVGGRCGTAILSSTECYDPRTDQWTSRADMNQARRWHGVAAGHGFLYSVGGKCGTDYLNTVERYDPRTNTWTQICSLTNSEAYVSCVFLGDERLLAIPGFTGFVEEYNYEANTWTQWATTGHSGDSFKVVSIPKIN